MICSECGVEIDGAVTCGYSHCPYTILVPRDDLASLRAELAQVKRERDEELAQRGKP